MRNVKRAFTLIEILIVVVILGILAAIVIPQFTDASAEAMEANVRAQLQTIRGQIELYEVQMHVHGLGTYQGTAAPGDATYWNNLVNANYLQQNPGNPFQAGSETVAAAAAAGVGWVWDGEDLFAVGADDLLFAE